jgi:V/A-type H+-transporting ATPase subunit I
MIVQMKKLTLLCVAHDRGATLDALRGLGVLHVTPVTSPASTGLEDAREKAAGLLRLLEAVPVAAELPPTGRDLATVIADVGSLLDLRKEWTERLESLKAELERTAPFGAFDPADVRALAKKGIVLKLYRAPAKSVLPLPAGATAQKMDFARRTPIGRCSRTSRSTGRRRRAEAAGGRDGPIAVRSRTPGRRPGRIAEELKRTAGDRALLEKASAAARPT